MYTDVNQKNENWLKQKKQKQKKLEVTSEICMQEIKLDINIKFNLSIFLR